MARLSLPSPSNPRDSVRFIRELDVRLERLDRAILLADWDLQVGRSSEGSAPWQVKRARLLSDERLLEWVRAAQRKSWPSLDHRRLELLERVLLDTQVEQSVEVVRLRSALQRKIVAFRPLWKGKRVDRSVLHRAMQESPRQSERKRAFYAYESFHRPIEAPLRRLIELRNERARALGYRSMAEMRISFDRLTPQRLREYADEAAELARGRLRTLRETFQEETGQSSWEPWDVPYARHRRAPLPARWFPRREMMPRILAAVSKWGFRTDRMRFRVVFHDTPFGGLTLAPDPPRDVRILVHPQGGWNSYMIMFHEVGHAVHSSLIRAPRHLLRWSENVPGFGAFHEGIGGLFEDIPNGREWLATQPRVDAHQAEEFAREQRDGNLVWAAWHAVWVRTEELLYERPDRDPMPEVERFERRVFGFDAFRPRSFVDAFFVEAPLYVQNYLLAVLFGRQVSRTLRQLFGEPLWPNRKVGPWLSRNWFAPGSLYDWLPRMKEVTGRPFGIEAFRAEFAGLANG